MKQVNQEEFEQVIKEGIVLVDFFATWCGPCRIMSSILEDMSEELAGKAEVVKVDVDQEGELARKFGVMSIPTLILFKDGKEVEKHVGVWQREDCLEVIKSYL